MNLISQVSALTPLDYAAVAALVVAWFGLGWWIEHPGMARPSVTVLMADRNRAWMRQFVTRDPRIFDSQILASLRQGTSFFASTALLAIGGLLALMGNLDPIRGLAAEVGSRDAPVILWQIKLALSGVFLVNAFLKFVWANRVFGYCSVQMAAVPNDPADPRALPMAAQAAELSIRATMNFNRGLRGLYFSLGALVWLVGAEALMLATLAVVWLVWSREFASVPRRILIEPVE